MAKHARPPSRPGALALVLAASACGGAPSDPAAPAATSTGVAAGSAAPPPPSSAALPASQEGSAACAGARVDVGAALLDEACRVPRPASHSPSQAGALRVVRAPATPLAVRSGGWLTFEVHLANASDAPLVIHVDAPFAADPGIGDDLGDAFGAAGLDLATVGKISGRGSGRPPRPKASRPEPPPPPPPPPSTPGFSVAADDAKGRSLDWPDGVGSIGLLSAPLVTEKVARIEIAPRGIAVAQVAWRAIGYDPDVPVGPPPGADADEGFALPDKAPLKPQRARLRVALPLLPAMPSLPVDVDVLR